MPQQIIQSYSSWQSTLSLEFAPSGLDCRAVWQAARREEEEEGVTAELARLKFSSLGPSLQAQ